MPDLDNDYEQHLHPQITLGKYINGRDNPMDNMIISDKFTSHSKTIIAIMYAFVTDKTFRENFNEKHCIISKASEMKKKLFCIENPACTMVKNENSITNVIIGHVQSGKSSQIMTLMYFYEKCEYYVYNFIRNINGVFQKKETFQKYINSLNDTVEMISLVLNSELLIPSFCISKFKDIEASTKPTCTIELTNYSKLTKIPDSDKKTIFICDEIDEYQSNMDIEGKTSKAHEKFYENILSHPNAVLVCISATVKSIVFQKHDKMICHPIFLEPPLNYKGYHTDHIRIKGVIDPNDNTINTYERYKECFKYSLEYVKSQNVPYVNFLVCCEKMMCEQEKIVMNIAKMINRRAIIFTFNGSKRIDVAINKLVDQDLHIDSIIDSLSIDSNKIDGIEYMQLEGPMQIGELYETLVDKFQEMFGKLEPLFIVCVGGKKMERATTFKAVDKETDSHKYPPTHMFYDPKKLKNDSTILQTIGRLCGNDEHHTIPRTLFVPDSKVDIIKHIIQEEQDFVDSLKHPENQLKSGNQLLLNNYGKRGYVSDTPGSLKFNKSLKTELKTIARNENVSFTQEDAVLEFAKQFLGDEWWTVKQIANEMNKKEYVKKYCERTKENFKNTFFTDSALYTDVVRRSLYDLANKHRIAQKQIDNVSYYKF